MIPLIATAAILSCGEAKELALRVPTYQYTKREHREIINVIRDFAPRGCRIRARKYPRVVVGRHYIHPPFWQHPGVRPGWAKPGIRFDTWGNPHILIRNTFRFN